MNFLFFTHSEIRVGDLYLDLSRREACCGDRKSRVKATPFKLLVLLATNADAIVSRQTMFAQVWGYDFDPGTKIIDVQLNYLRKMLVTLECAVKIDTHRGKGLRLRVNGCPS